MEHLTEGACATLEFVSALFCTRSPSTANARTPKTPQTKRIATNGRKCEQRASFFCAVEGSFRSPFVQYRLRSLPRPLMDFFEASPGRGLDRPRNDIRSAKEPPPTDDIHLRWMKSLRDEILLRRVNSRGDH